MNSTLKTTSTLKSIQEMIEDDFNVQISKATAKKIREAKRRGTVVWTSGHLRIIGSWNVEITEGKVRENSAVYSAAEWRKLDS